MPSTYDSLLRLELQASGENQNTWGTKTNTNFELLADAIAGYDADVVVTGSGDYALTTSNAAEDEARFHALNFTGVLTGNRTVIAPATSKTYIVRNSTSGSFTLSIKPAGGTAVAIPADSAWYHVFIDGSVANLVRAPATPFITSTTAAPPLTFDGDSDTGLASFAANTLTAIASASPVFTAGVSTLTVFGSVSVTDNLNVGGNLVVIGSVQFSAPVSSNTSATFRELRIEATTNPTLIVAKTTAGSGNFLLGRTSSLSRWAVVLGDSATESGSNNGSDFSIFRYDDAGAFINSPLAITRSTGVLNVNVSADAAIQVTRSAVRAWTHNIDSSGRYYLGDATAVQARLGLDTSGVLSVPYGTNYGVPVNPQGVVASPTGFLGLGNLNAADGFNFINFARNGVGIGSVSQSGGGSTVNYNTASDYRLKENVLSAGDSLGKLCALPVYKYNFIGAEARLVGMLAHEVQRDFPYAVTGEKDAVDGEGNIIPQQVDYSKLVPDLIRAVQQLTARVRELEIECKTRY